MKRLNKIISLLLVVLMLASLILTSCEGNNGNGEGEGSGTNSGSTNNGGSGGNQDVVTPSTEYTITIKTKGGMPMANTSVYIYGYKNGAIDESDFVDFTSTDDKGVAKIKLEDGKGYAVKINSSVPDGYEVEDYYPIVGTTLNIQVGSSVITGESIDGKTLGVGDIMYDFTVTMTDGKKFTLSEMLKTHDAVVINFWYDGCSWCEYEFPIMETVYRNQGGEGYTYDEKIALIALSPLDSASDVINYKNLNGYDLNMASDSNGVIADAFGIMNYPTTVVIDRYGMISLVEEGALTTERPFRVMFNHFIGDGYQQQIIPSLESITPREKPSDYNIVMPESDALADAFEQTDLGITYANDPDDEYSWPFVIDEYDNSTVIRPSNTGIEASYAQLFATVSLKAGDVIAFDYFSSTEQGADILYVLVDGKDIYFISGDSTEEGWATCYAYVAEDAGTYELAFCYMKDDSNDVSDDTVYLKNLRIETEDDIDAPTYIYRFAATDPNDFGEYESYVDIVLGTDGYYHVGTADGPILLADLMGYTRFSSENSFYELITGSSIEETAIDYCSYASNSNLYGLCPVNEELMGLLKTVANSSDNRWLEFCCYYDSYGKDENGAPFGELEDPIKGLSTFSAYDTILSETGATDFPNSVTYNRVIMPRGLFFKLTPETSGTYLVISDSKVDGAPVEVNSWIFREQDIENRNAWLTYDVVARGNDDTYNCYMMAYLEAGVDYYINIAYYDVYQYGTIDFRVERIGGEGHHRLTIAAPGYFTYTESTSGAINKIQTGGIDIVFKNHGTATAPDGYWYEKRTDGRDGSLLYADFTKYTHTFSRAIYDPDAYDMIDAGAFDFRYTEYDQYVINYLDRNNVVKAGLSYLWGADYSTKYAENHIDEVLAGTYEGTDKAELEELVNTAVYRALWGDDYEIYSQIFDIDELKSNSGFDAVGPDANDAYIACILAKNDGNQTKAKAELREAWGDDYDANYAAYKVDEVFAGIYHSEGDAYAKSLVQRAVFMLVWGTDYEALAVEYQLEDVIAGKYHGVAPSDKDMEIIRYITINNGDTAATERYLRTLWGDSFATKAEEYKISEVFNGKYHGEGKDYTNEVLEYLEANIIKGGEYHAVLDETIAEDDVRIGCVVVDEQVSVWLQLLMDKYTFAGVDHSWTKLCYYAHYFCSATPI